MNIFGKSARFEVIQKWRGDKPLIIRDIGPWDKHPSVTNDPEGTVEGLVAQGLAPKDGELLYFDSEGQLDALKIRNGQFAGFAPTTYKFDDEQSDISIDGVPYKIE